MAIFPAALKTFENVDRVRMVGNNYIIDGAKAMSNILILEKNQDILEVLVQILEEANYNPLSATDQTEALELLGLAIDLVIVGEGRPDRPCENLIFLEKLNTSYPEVPVMNLAKPFDMAELLIKVKEFVA